VGEVWLVAFHPKFTSSLGVKRVKLDGTYKNVPDVSTSSAVMQAVPSEKAGIISLLGTIAHEANRIVGDRDSATLAEKLLQQVRGDQSTQERRPATRITPSTFSDYPNSQRVGTDQTMDDYYLTRSFRTADSVERVKEWYIAEGKRRDVPLVSQKTEEPTDLMADRYGIRDAVRQRHFLSFGAESRETASRDNPQIQVSIWHDERPEYGPTRISYQFWGPPAKK
jgi:hypothetical protein